MPTARSRTPTPSKPKRGAWFIILSLIVMVAALTFLGLQRYASTSQRTPATPATAPVPAPGGAGGDSSPPAHPNIDRNG